MNFTWEFSLNDLITIGLTLIAIAFGYWTWRIDQKAQTADEEHREVVKKLARLEWIAQTKETNVLVFFGNRASLSEKGKLDSYLVVKNIGNVEAREITISITNVDGGESGIIFLNGLEPIGILAPGLDIAFIISTWSVETDKYIASWSWINPNGTKSEKSSNLVIAGLVVNMPAFL